MPCGIHGRRRYMNVYLIGWWNSWTKPLSPSKPWTLNQFMLVCWTFMVSKFLMTETDSNKWWSIIQMRSSINFTLSTCLRKRKQYFRPKGFPNIADKLSSLTIRVLWIYLTSIHSESSNCWMRVVKSSLTMINCFKKFVRLIKLMPCSKIQECNLNLRLLLFTRRRTWSTTSQDFGRRIKMKYQLWFRRCQLRVIINWWPKYLRWVMRLRLSRNPYPRRLGRRCKIWWRSWTHVMCISWDV